jgi:hypothetical protein
MLCYYAEVRILVFNTLNAFMLNAFILNDLS